MRILFVHNRYQFRGGEDSTLQGEYDLLAANGHEVSLLEFDNDNISGLLSKVKTGLAALYNRRSAKLLEEKINSFKPDIIHVHNLFFTASPSILFKAKRMRIPLVMTVQNFRLVCANALLLRDNHVCELCVQKTFPLDGIRYKCYRGSAVESALVTSITSLHKVLATWKNKIDQFIVVSDILKNKLQHSSAKIPGNKIVILPNMREDPLPNLENRSGHYLFVGRLSYEKGLDTLLDAFAAMPETKLVIAGDGPLKDMVVQRILSLPNISYIGLQSKDQVTARMKECKALIFPSRWYEGMPLTIIESLATGTPVIAGSIGVMTEMIQDGYNGFLFEAGNSLALTHRIRQFESMGQQSAQLYKDARQSYLDRYHPEIHYRSLLTIYDKTLASVPSNAR